LTKYLPCCYSFAYPTPQVPYWGVIPKWSERVHPTSQAI
jgi:hypothetical protein